MDDIRPIADRFLFEGDFHSAVPYGNGHINETYAVRYASADGTSRRYILQRINRHVFRHPVHLMQNMVAVSDHIRTRVAAAGGDPDRSAVTVVPTREGAPFFQHEDGTFWRGQVFIEGSLCIDQVEDVRHLYEAGKAFGEFQRMLGDFPVDCLYETIPDFHNTHRSVCGTSRPWSPKTRWDVSTPSPPISRSSGRAAPMLAVWSVSLPRAFFLFG